MLNKILAIPLVLAALALLAYKLYFWIMPQVIVENLYGEAISSVSIQLPTSQLVFDNIRPNSRFAIAHKPPTQDGNYNYLVLFMSGKSMHGECGTITANHYQQHMTLTIDARQQVSCQ
ncbi:MAG: hypothetical protein ACI9FJ_002884 [Alteromonadaceae bacterium]|jgi:hypothetical protein